MRKRKETTLVPAPIDPSQLQLLDVPATARLLSVGRTSVYALIKKGDLPAVKVNSSTRIPLVSIQQLIEKQQQAS
jgi:excisionase family DNA binding protein